MERNECLSVLYGIQNDTKEVAAMREIQDYFYEGSFLFRIGNVSYTKATKPLQIHNHGKNIEFVFMLKGRQQYQVESVSYLVSGGEVFAAFPGEAHSTGEAPEEKASFYYLIVDIENVISQTQLCMPQEAEMFRTALLDMKKRVRKSKEWYGKICSELMELCKGKVACRDTKIRNFLSVLLLDLSETDGTEAGGENQNENVEPAIDYIRKHVKENPELEELAVLTGLSLSRFKHCFLKKTGIPPREYILRKKLELCKKELETPEKSVTEIAFEYGFSSSQYFSTVFKRYCLISPLDYRKKKVSSELYKNK